jgi:hypothetical protein
MPIDFARLRAARDVCCEARAYEEAASIRDAVEEIEASRASRRWTKATPAAVGWYWIRFPGHPEIDPAPVEIVEARSGTLAIDDATSPGGRIDIPADAEWCRIVEPGDPGP